MQVKLQVRKVEGEVWEWAREWKRESEAATEKGRGSESRRESESRSESESESESEGESESENESESGSEGNHLGRRREGGAEVRKKNKNPTLRMWGKTAKIRLLHKNII